MCLDMKRCYHEMKSLIYSGEDVIPGIHTLINMCNTLAPNVIWNEIRELDYENDISHLEEWLVKLLDKQPPGDNVGVLSFGLFENYEGEKAGNEEHLVYTDMYLGGYESLTKGEIGWEPKGKLIYLPEGAEAKSSVLREIYWKIDDICDWSEVFVDDPMYGIYELGPCFLTLGYAALCALHFCRKTQRMLLIGGREHRVVEVGFDCGDTLVIGSVNMNRLILGEPPYD